MTFASFTGTRKGMTQNQLNWLAFFFGKYGVTWLIHGDCVGADAQADALAVHLGIQRIAWPGVDSNGDSPHRAFCRSDVIMDPRPYLERDQLIVAGAAVLFAAPETAEEQPRSGTWYTIRYARKIGRKLEVITP